MRDGGPFCGSGRSDEHESRVAVSHSCVTGCATQSLPEHRFGDSSSNVEGRERLSDLLDIKGYG